MNPDPEDVRWPERASGFEGAVEAMLLDGQRHTRLELETVGGKEATRRVRSLRQRYLIGREHIGKGMWEYWIIGPRPRREAQAS